MMLEKRIELMQEDMEKKDAQIGQILTAANLDPTTVAQVNKKVEEELEEEVFLKAPPLDRAPPAQPWLKLFPPAAPKEAPKEAPVEAPEKVPNEVPTEAPTEAPVARPPRARKRFLPVDTPPRRSARLAKD